MKNFFKITKNKIILGLAVMALNIGTAFYSALAVLCTDSCPTPNIIQKLFSPAIEPFVVIKLFSEFFENMTFLPRIATEILPIIPSVIVLLFFWYFIACLLIKSYSLLKTK